MFRCRQPPSRFSPRTFEKEIKLLYAAAATLARPPNLVPIRMVKTKAEAMAKGSKKKKGAVSTAEVAAAKAKAASERKKRKDSVSDQDELEKNDEEEEEEEESEKNSSSSTSSQIAKTVDTRDKIKKVTKTLHIAEQTDRDLQARIDAQNKNNDTRMRELSESRMKYPSVEEVKILLFNCFVFSRKLIVYV